MTLQQNRIRSSIYVPIKGVRKLRDAVAAAVDEFGYVEPGSQPIMGDGCGDAICDVIIVRLCIVTQR